MKNLLEYILIRLVEYPEEIQVNESTMEDGTILLTVNANEADYGRIIGKAGAVISAIRSIIRVRAIKEGKRAIVKVDADKPATDDTPAVSQEATIDTETNTIAQEVTITDSQVENVNETNEAETLNPVTE